jgi:hypothetical protein
MLINAQRNDSSHDRLLADSDEEKYRDFLGRTLGRPAER